ncbi:LysR substrate-binding domain-containing protein [Brevundimonas sp. VNH65]|uniref:LysR substrate-binding domain-containing protein n=1 Tax=Brevundimonas sp. VNH65 TaxID=3400917 RepID=UPI000A3693AE|nr:LysR family transcriptional regulator [Novosphingobium panipatense]
MPDLALDLRYLRYAHLAAEYGSFRRAAQAVGVNQSTLTRRVQLLERRLGIVLFDRRRTGVALTPVGSHFLQEARVGAEQLHRAVKELALLRRGHDGQLRIGLMGTLAQGPLPELLASFRASYPGIRIRVEEAALDDNVAGISRGQLDIAFVIGEPQIEGCNAVRIWDEPLLVAAPAEHPIGKNAAVRWRDLADETFLVSSDAFGLKVAEVIGAQLRRFGRKPRISLQRVGRDNLMYLVEEGFGLTLAAKSMLGATYPGLQLVSIQTADRFCWSAIWSDDSTNPALKNLTKRLRRHASA